MALGVLFEGLGAGAWFSGESSRISKLLAISLLLGIFPVSDLAQAPVSATNNEAALELARAQELDELDRRIGRFVSGKVPVYAGTLAVSARGSAARTPEFPVSRVVAWIESYDELGGGVGPGIALTAVSKRNDAWVRFGQPSSAPEVTLVSRPRPMRSGVGLSGSCKRCLADLSGKPTRLALRRLVAKGQVSGSFGARFVVEAAGTLELMPPEQLTLADLELLNPGPGPLLRGEIEGFTRSDNEGILKVERRIRQRLPSPGPAPSPIRCERETTYSAVRFVALDSLDRFGVRDLELLGSRVCCVDHEGHGEADECRDEANS